MTAAPVTAAAPTTAPDCLFCRIVAGEVPATQVLATADVVAFRDVNPQAPTHVLVIPRVHVATIEELVRYDDRLAATLLRAAADVAHSEGLTDDGWRTVFNTGRDGGQTVLHVHAHVLGGRPLGWPPG